VVLWDPGNLEIFTPSNLPQAIHRSLKEYGNALLSSILSSGEYNEFPLGVVHGCLVVRLRVPDRPSIIQQVFKRGTKFRYSGRTFNQVKDDVNPAREEPLFVRSQSLRLKSKSKVSS
jgi:hypothetical protein